MTNSIDLRDVLDGANVDYKIYTCLSSNAKHFLWNCVRFKIPNPPSSFKIGDIVIRKINKDVDCDSYGVPIKWKVAALSYGLIIGTKMMGSRQGRYEVINDAPWLKHSIEIEVDPDYIENILLGNDTFLPNAKRDASLKLRRQASRYNKSISTKIKNDAEAHNFFMTLKLGDKLYSSKLLIGLTSAPRIWEILAPSCSDSSDNKPMILEVKLPSGVCMKIVPKSIIGYFVTAKEPYPLSKILNV